MIEPIHRHRREGQSFFKARLAIALGVWTAWAAIAWMAFSAARGAGAFEPGFAWSGAVLLKLFAAPLALFFAVLLLWSFFGVMIDHFVVLVMALDRAAFVPAFKKVWGIFGANKKDIFLFYVLLVLLSFASGIAALILILLGALVLVLLGVVVFGLGYLLLAKAKVFFIIYCFALGVPFILALLFFGVLVALTIAVFFRSFSIEYFCALGVGYSAESLDDYEKEKSPERSTAIIVLPVLAAVVLLVTFAGGLMAAIAVPNFIQARAAAQAKAAAAKKGV